MASFSTALIDVDQRAARARSARRERIAMRRGRALRRQMRAVQRLADIDIAEPGDDALVEQRRLQRWSSCRRRLAPASRRRTRCRAARARARAAAAPASSSRARTSFMKPKRRGSLKVTIAPFDMWNTTWSCARELASARGGTCPGVSVARRRTHAERARHAEMHQQHLAGRQIRQQILGAPAEPARRSGPSAASRNPSATDSAGRRGAPRPRTKRAPSIAGSRPRRTVSTSGSSGMVNSRRDRGGR